MFKLKRYFNKNTKKIFIFIAIIILVIAVIQVLNQIVKNKEKQEINNISENYINKTERDTVITEGKVEKEKNDKFVELINSFINYCNDKKFEDAYELLSSDCKQQLYPTVESFKKSYCNMIFSVKRQANIQSWITKNGIYTYKVTLIGDLLSNMDSSQTEDYYSIINENNKLKLNINNFIGKKVLNKDAESDKIKIKANFVYIYMDYEIYDFEIINDTNNDIQLDTKKKTDTMYIMDNNNNWYSSQNYQLTSNDLTIKAKNKKQINISYGKGYNSKSDTKEIVFSNIVSSLNSQIDDIKISL